METLLLAGHPFYLHMLNKPITTSVVEIPGEPNPYPATVIQSCAGYVTSNQIEC